MSETTELTLPERAAVALGTAEHEKRLVELATKYSDITAIANPAGREQVHSAYMSLKNARIDIDNIGKAAREDANAFRDAVIAEAKRLIGIVEPEEARLKKLRDDFDEVAAREKAAKAAAEKARVDGIKARIERFMLDAMTVGDQTSSAIDAHATRLSETVISLDEYMEFAGEAQMKRDDTVKWLRERQRQAAEREAEAVRLKAEREALERQRAEEAARLAAERAELDRLRAEQEERERQAAAARAAQEAADRAERERIEAEQRAAQERAAAAMRAEQEAHEARMREQQAELARQQAELDRQRAETERVERERQEAIAAEEQRKQEEAEAAARAEAQRAAEAVAADAERREREARAEAERAALAAEVSRLQALNFANDGLGMLEDVLQEIAQPIGRECCGRPGSECCGCPDPVYHDIESLSTELNKWRNEIIARRTEQKEAA